MKYCPYCGASLPGSAVSFCPECGKALPSGEAAARPSQRKPPKPTRRRRRGRYPSPSKPAPKTVPAQPRAHADGYDGYYDDVQPLDAGQRGESMDPELVKRIALLIAGAVGLIALAAALMTML